MRSEGENARTRREETKDCATPRGEREAAAVAVAVAAAAEGAVARDEMREGRVEEAKDRDVNHNM